MCFHRSCNHGAGISSSFVFHHGAHTSHALLQVQDLHVGERKKKTDSKVGTLPEPTVSSLRLKSCVPPRLRPPLPLRRTGRHRGGSGGICPATSLPSG